ncbi:unnamed protein product [Bursaphelenchus xylophilus]|uniref:(pine wood nematode) hypothetical protein n=1 Tax=Bursaphelenchus xylophilus TaxID=6326 RepID=A0A7I8X6Z1_BURXY|nr:unnamed protein product [Bursaphelenchus xylophilus]CAG9126483.1 unnamed protein product [Bursaphelenchus xylophilus]
MGVDRVDPLVVTKSGPVEGFNFETRNGNVHVFLGIPYAEPPVGELRYELPCPVKPWTRTFKAKEFSLAAVPHHDLGTKVAYGEDCLTINVMCPPTRPKTGGWPTVFFVHPSAYNVGSAMWMRFEGFCENIVSQGIVVVTFHYRLGWLGFASTGDSVMPGNYGLHDQALALRWTLDNISAFGGDPKDLTAWGMSTGGVSVGYLTISPKTRDHFKRSIQNSGALFGPVTLGENCVDETKKLARALGCNSNDSKTIKEFLKRCSVREIMDAHERLGRASVSFSLKWLPRLDGDFLPKDLRELIKESKPIPVLAGFATDEMAYFYHGFLEAVHSLTITEEWKRNFNREMLINRIRNVHFTERDYGPEASKIADRVIDFYVWENAPKHHDPLLWINTEQRILSHITSLVPMFLEYRAKHLNGAPVYVYQNPYWREHHFGDDPKQPLRGCLHVSEMKQFFNTPIPSKYEFNEEDLKHKHVLVQSHVNFIKTSNPSFDNIQWPAVTNQNICTHLVVKPEPEIRTYFEGEQKSLKFWLDLVNEFGDKVIRTRHARRRLDEYDQSAILRARL